MIADVDILVFQALQNLFDRFGWFGLLGLMVFENVTGMTPNDLVLIMAGWLLLAAHAEPQVMIFVGGFYTALAGTLGASLSYWLVRYGGRPLVEKALRWVRIDLRYLSIAEQQFQRWGPGLVLFGRVVPVVRIWVNIPAGLARMPYLKFFIFTFLGTYVWCTFFLGLGYTIGNQWQHIREQVGQYAPWLLAGFLAFFVIAILLRQVVLQRLRLPDVLAPAEDD